MAQDGLAAFEPAYLDELATVMDWSFDYMQRDGEGDPDERTWLRDQTGGSVYLRLSTRPLEQPAWRSDAAFRQGVIDGAYWLREPGPGCDLVIAYQGVVASEALEAAGRIGNDRRDIGVLAVTSADRLNAGWQAAIRMRKRGLAHATSHIERLLGRAIPSVTLPGYEPDPRIAAEPIQNGRRQAAPRQAQRNEARRTSPQPAGSRQGRGKPRDRAESGASKRAAAPAERSRNERTNSGRPPAKPARQERPAAGKSGDRSHASKPRTRGPRPKAALLGG